MQISVVIPVVNKKLANSLLYSIEHNTVLPKKVVVIDNTTGRIPYRYNDSRLGISYYRPSVPMSVNESWRYGFEVVGKCDAISVLNDDLKLNTNFFARTARVLSSPGVAVSCPFTISKLEDLKDYPIEKYEIQGMRKREGWAFTIKKNVLAKLPPIPDHIVKTFYGDDWLYFWTATLRRWEWNKDTLNWVWHKGGVTVSRYGLKKTKKAEKRIYHAHRVSTYNKYKQQGEV